MSGAATLAAAASVATSVATLAAALAAASADALPAELATAVATAPAAMAWQQSVTVQADSGVHGLRLPPDVYLHAQTATLGDMRMVDRIGNPVAFALRIPPDTVRTVRKEAPVRIFRLLARPQGEAAPAAVPDGRGNYSSGGSGAGMQLDIRSDADGRLLSVTTRATPAAQAQVSSQRNPPPPAASFDTLILDMPRTAGNPGADSYSGMRFEAPTGQSNYIAQIWLDVSDDLRQWHPLATGQLSWLANPDAQTLSVDRITFQPRAFRYARLTWCSGTPAAFAAIHVESVDTSSTPPQMDSVLLMPKPGRLAGDLAYQGGIAMPVEKIALRFPGDNAVLPATLGAYRDLPPVIPAEREYDADHQYRQHHPFRHLHESHLRQHLHHLERGQGGSGSNCCNSSGNAAPDPGRTFEPLHSTTFYVITQDGRRRQSGDIGIPTTQTAQWVVRPRAPLSKVAMQGQLQLSWTPATLLFLANGNGPYRMLYGGADSHAALDVTQVAPGFTDSELLALPPATAAAAMRFIATVAPQAAVAPTAKKHGASPPVAGRSAAGIDVLWLVLITGVLVLAYFTWALMKPSR